MGKLKSYLGRLRDPRAANASYPLLEILFVALAKAGVARGVAR